jgi:hypothetical protein
METVRRAGPAAVEWVVVALRRSLEFLSRLARLVRTPGSQDLHRASKLRVRRGRSETADVWPLQNPGTLVRATASCSFRPKPKAPRNLHSGVAIPDLGVGMRVDLEQFEDAYNRDRDPWNFTTSSYEQRKYDVTVASLVRPRYARCFEPGCSIGALTARLASRADEVIAADASSTAACTATKRLQRFSNVVVTNDSIPDTWPTGNFDLIVWSELGYYWDAPELQRIIRHAQSLLTVDGHFLAVHWLGCSDDHLLSGSEVHAIIGDTFGDPVVHHIEPQFILDLWTMS